MNGTMTWPKVAVIVGGCAVGGFVGGVGLAALITAITARRAMERLGLAV